MLKRKTETETKDRNLRHVCGFWDRCFEFKNIFAKKSAKIAFLIQNKAKLFLKN
jgi:hypothetical protein